MNERELEIWLVGLLHELRALPTEEERRERIRYLIEWARERRRPDYPSGENREVA
jgi:hypothetical protein